MTTPSLKGLIFPVLTSAALLFAAVGVPIYAYTQERARADVLSTAYMQLQIKHATYRTQVEKAAEAAWAATKQAQQRMKTDNNKAQEQKDAEIQALKRRVGDLADELLKRPQRPTQPATHAALGAGHQEADAQLHCTGAQLYREDGNFLAGEVAAAETLRAELKQCEADLGAAHEASEQLKTHSAVFFGQESN